MMEKVLVFDAGIHIICLFNILLCSVASSYSYG